MKAGSSRVRNRSLAGQVGLYAFLLACLLIFTFPLVWLFYSSLKPQKEIFESAFALPRQVNITNLVHIWSSSSFPRYYLNSLFVSSVSVLGILAFSTMAGYVFARIRFKGKELLYLVLIAGMMIPIQVTLVPNFVFLRNLGLLDTYAAMILPYIAFQIPISIFIIFAVWNELIFALTFTNSQKYRTIPVGLMDFVGQFETDYGYIFAALASASIPLLVVYFFAQKQIIKGLTAGAVKG